MHNARSQHLNAMDDGAFRQAFRDWLAQNYPEAWRQDDRRPFLRLRGDDHLQWIRMLDEAGWRCPAWPAEHGGLGLGFRKQVIYQEELERAHAARVIDLGDVQLGPTIILHGTDAQKREILPRIRSGEQIWCQGYSEPGAGSDLASLTTAAVSEGDAFRVTGQKIWTTHANDSTHIFALVRTAKLDRKQAGITFLLIDMASPGITVRPIDNLAGEDEFCEVFFDDVLVPAANVVGAVDQGWAVAKSLLGYERVWIGSPGLATRALALARSLMDATPPDLGRQDRFGVLACDLHDLRALYRLTCDRIAEGGEPGPEVSVLKIVASDLLQRITEFNAETAAEATGIAGDATIGPVTVDIAWQYFMSRPGTIFAGSNEIQKNILAKAVLGLPGS